MFILLSIPSGLEFWSGTHASIYEHSESIVFENIKFLGEISNNWPNDLLRMNKCIQEPWIMLIIVVYNITVD